MSALLETRELIAGYGRETLVVRNLNICVNRGETVALLGPNGAGKSTTLMTLAGELMPWGGQVLFDGVPTTAPLHLRARNGLGLVTERRNVFTQLTVAENLRVSRCDEQRALAIFPELEMHLDRLVGLLSGGQQQMLALARALTRGQPRLLLIDELSLGLAPLIIDRLLQVVRDVAATGVGVLLVEQHIHKALSVADRIYVMRRGQIELSGCASEFVNNVSAIERAYLAADGESESEHNAVVELQSRRGARSRPEIR